MNTRALSLCVGRCRGADPRAVEGRKDLNKGRILVGGYE